MGEDCLNYLTLEEALGTRPAVRQTERLNRGAEILQQPTMQTVKAK